MISCRITAVLVRLGALALLLAYTQLANATKPPSWIGGYFLEKTNSYIHVVHAKGFTREEALTKANQQVVEQRSMSAGRRININYDQGTPIIKEDNNLTVKSRILDEYIEYDTNSGIWMAHLLVQVAKHPELPFETAYVSERYNMPETLMALVPGLAQYYKGSPWKGSFFLLGELAFAGVAIGFELSRREYLNRANVNNFSAKYENWYKINAKKQEVLRNVMIGCGAALYVWIVTDGILTKGKKHLVVGCSQVHMSPYFDGQNTGVAMRINF